jgi:hypothetical protein
MWQWILDVENQRNLAFFGGGAAAVVCAAWSVFKFISAKRAESSKGNQVIAKNHSIAAGGDVTVGGSPDLSRRG